MNMTKRQAIAEVRALADAIIEQNERRARGWDKGVYRDDLTDAEYLTVHKRSIAATLRSYSAEAFALSAAHAVVPEVAAPVARTLESYSDKYATLPRTLQRLVDSDPRVVAVTVEQDGVFIYTDSRIAHAQGMPDCGTFRGDNIREAISYYKETVTDTH